MHYIPIDQKIAKISAGTTHQNVHNKNISPPLHHFIDQPVQYSMTRWKKSHLINQIEPYMGIKHSNTYLT